MPDLTLDDDRATGAWVASLISTLLTLPACLAAWFFGGFSAMACDVCDGTESARFEASYAVAFPILPGSLGRTAPGRGELGAAVGAPQHGPPGRGRVRRADAGAVRVRGVRGAGRVAVGTGPHGSAQTTGPWPPVVLVP
ncbi:hypothetical protein ABZY05_16490 [Streptomyces canus]|uniref:hypothetical protein n=1 Tax=Streptomyces canus TaxID=58343 RepID=UPI0033BF41E7